jgi:hypothetical protein
MAKFFVTIIRLLLNLWDIETTELYMFRVVALSPMPMPAVLLFGTIWFTDKMWERRVLPS